MHNSEENIINLIKKSDFIPKIGSNELNIYLNNYSYYMLRNVTLNSNTKILSDGLFFVNCLNFMLRKKIKRNSFDFTSNANEIFNYVSVHNKKLIIVGSTTQNSLTFKNFIQEKYKLENCISIDGFKKNMFEYLKSYDLNNSFVIIGTGSPFQEKLASFVYDSFKNVEVYTCGGFITQTAESIIENNSHKYYPVFFNKYNLRWLYRLINTKFVFKRLVYYYPISTINLFYKLIFLKK